MSAVTSEIGHFSDMPTGFEDVRSLGKTGSDRRPVKATRLTRNGHLI
jgi:hypothetical protein